MGMTPENFLEAFVEFNHIDCLQEPGDIRRAFNAAVSASHLADQYFTYHQRHNPGKVASFKTIGAFIAHLEAISNGAFRDIRSISNAYKHLYTDAQSNLGAFASVNSSGSIERLELNSDQPIEAFEEEYGASTGDDDSRFRVVFTRRDGTKSEFLPVLEATLDCLRKLVYEGA